METQVPDYKALIESLRSSETWVPASGRKPSRIVYVGEAPGMEEVKEKYPFCGPSGAVNWQIARRHAGLARGMSYVTNWCKTPLSKERKESMEDAEKREWTGLLHSELSDASPELVIALGAYAVEALLGPGHSLFWCNGLAFAHPEYQVVIPVVHPAAGLHEANMLQLTVDGYRGVREFLDGKAELISGWAPNPVSKLWTDWLAEGVDPFVLPIVEGRPTFAADTEGLLRDQFGRYSREGVHSIQWALDEQRGVFMYSTDKIGLSRLSTMLQNVKPLVVFQNAPHDLDVCAAIDLPIRAWGLDVEDTMEYAFADQRLSRGLKPLAQRLLNVKMRDYKELVDPYAEASGEEWNGRAYIEAMKHVELQQQFTAKTGKPKMSKGSPVFKRIGPEIQLGLVKHVERNQKLHDDEIRWAERVLHEKKPGLELKFVPEPLAIDYAGRDACVTLGALRKLRERTREAGLDAVIDLDHATLPMVEEMMHTGLHVDLDRYWEVAGEISAAKQETESIIRGIVETEFPGKTWNKAGDPFNPASGDQVAEFCRLMYEREGRLKLTRLTKSRKRFSVDDNALKMVQHEHPFVPYQLQFKELEKLDGTYLVPMQERIRQIGDDEYRLFMTLKPYTVVSGRYASEDPNVLAWPTRTKNGMKLRSIFTAPKGMKLGSWDSSQVEMRIAAAFSKDPVMRDIFLKGLDPHTKLASELFGKPYDECHGGEDEKGPGRQMYRAPCKNLNYGWIYGIGPDKLYEECMALGITQFKREDYERFLAETRKIYRKCAEWLADAAREAREFGFVSDWLGRRRYLPACSLQGRHWQLSKLRLEAERQAGNHKIQACNSELLKRTMVTVKEKVYPLCRQEGIHFRLWLQVHDELLAEVTDDKMAIEKVNGWMRDAMTQDSWLVDPLKIETKGKFGKCWADLK